MEKQDNQGEGNVEADKRYREMAREFVENGGAERENKDITPVRKLVEGARTVMLTSSNEKGALASRPLTVQAFDADGTTWFVVDRSAHWLRGEHATNVNISFAEGTDGWVSISGVGFMVEDQHKLEQLWDKALDLWFDDGPSSGKAVVFRVDPRRVEWWTERNTLKQIWQIAKAIVTDGKPDLGNRGTVEVPAAR